MARRRMFNLDLATADQFMNLSAGAQSFYFQLNLHADDEGFVAGARRLSLFCGTTEEDLQNLADIGYIIQFESGVVLITHWHIHNTIRKDRFMPSLHRKEKALVTLVDHVYELADMSAAECTEPEVNIEEPIMSASMASNMSTNNDTVYAAQYNIDKSRIEKLNKDKFTPIQNSTKQTTSFGIDSAVDIDKDNGWAFGDLVEKISDQRTRLDLADENPEQKDIISSAGKSGFTKPTFPEVNRYCKNEGLQHVNPIEFWGYYNMNGWLDKENKPIHDWHALARSWNERNKRINT